MTEDWIERRFATHVRPVVFADAQPSTDPVWITVGGQPGAGKTAAQLLARRLNPDASVSPIIGDDLRFFHPEYTRLVKEDPIRMPDLTAEASGAWIRASLDHARDHRYGVLVESTFRRPEVTTSTADSFHQAGYRTHVIAVAVQPWESRLSTLDRFVIDHAAGRAARWTPLEAHEAGVAGVPQTLSAAAGSASVDRISVVNRAGTVLFDGTRPGALHEALTILEQEHMRPPTPGELKNWMSRLSNNTHYLEQNVPATAGTRSLTEALRADQESLVDAANHRRATSMAFATSPADVVQQTVSEPVQARSTFVASPPCVRHTGPER